MLIAGKLPLHTEGQLEVPKQPPFDVLTPGWGVRATVQLGEGDPNLIRIFDAWYHRRWLLDVCAGVACGQWLQARMQCITMDRQQGIQVTRAWDPPRRHAWGQMYRPTPRFQRITRPAYTYVLAAERYDWCAAPEAFKQKALVVEAVN